ncbi:hypothetical protein NEAUS06_1726 [Nematocida ausubeli]|nr:hypothetical protein NEAUS06_1726 [Nematocida ausubeli]
MNESIGCEEINHSQTTDPPYYNNYMHRVSLAKHKSNHIYPVMYVKEAQKDAILVHSSETFYNSAFEKNSAIKDTTFSRFFNLLYNLFVCIFVDMQYHYSMFYSVIVILTSSIGALGPDNLHHSVYNSDSLSLYRFINLACLVPGVFVYMICMLYLMIYQANIDLSNRKAWVTKKLTIGFNVIGCIFCGFIVWYLLPCGLFCTLMNLFIRMKILHMVAAIISLIIPSEWTKGRSIIFFTHGQNNSLSICSVLYVKYTLLLFWISMAVDIQMKQTEKLRMQPCMFSGEMYNSL